MPVYHPRILAVAAAQSHVEGYYQTHSPAFTCCNPGNITAWGETPKRGRFCQFPTRAAGFDALYRDIEKNRYMRLRDFIGKYAPPSENNTSQYLELVSTYTGIGPDEVIAP